MEPAPSIPAAAKAVVDRYLALAADRGVELSGLYLAGSIALGDYQPGRSDVDFLALCERAPDADRLADVHARLAEIEGPDFDGVYLDRARLLISPGPEERATFVVKGRFSGDAVCGELNPTLFDCLTQSGIAVFGPAIADLGIATDRDATRAYVRRNLATYWAGWMDDAGAALAAKASGDTASAEAISWGVLGVCRMAATLETGRILSKTAAGDWALGRTALADPSVDLALAARRGEIERISLSDSLSALAYMRRVAQVSLQG